MSLPPLQSTGYIQDAFVSQALTARITVPIVTATASYWTTITTATAISANTTIYCSDTNVLQATAGK